MSAAIVFFFIPSIKADAMIDEDIAMSLSVLNSLTTSSANTLLQTATTFPSEWHHLG